MLRGCISCYVETDMTIWEISETADYIADRHRHGTFETLRRQNAVLKGTVVLNS
ncbi:hypothetical protein Q6247_27135, partial [Klebsiella pneumoniae]